MPRVEASKLSDERANAAWRMVVEAFHRNDMEKAVELGKAFMSSDLKTSAYQLLGVKVMLGLAGGADSGSMFVSRADNEEKKKLEEERASITERYQELATIYRDADARTIDADDFLHHDGIAARRRHRAGHDPDALAGCHHAGVGAAGHGGANDAQRRLAGAIEVGVAQRVAIHRRVVGSGNVARGDQVTGQHAAKRAAQRDALAGQPRAQLAVDESARLVDRERVGIVIVEATETGGKAHGKLTDD